MSGSLSPRDAANRELLLQSRRREIDLNAIRGGFQDGAVVDLKQLLLRLDAVEPAAPRLLDSADAARKRRLPFSIFPMFVPSLSW
jgi:hypothetical protein